MRSRRDYIVTKDEVYSYANDWLSAALRLEYEGTKCTASTLFQVLLIAAARVVSIFAACRDLADAPSDQTIRNALAASLPEIAELERRLNRALVTKLPKALRRKARMVAIDLTLIPYHGHGFIIPAAARGRKPKAPKQATGLRALLKRNNGYYKHTLQSNVGGKRRSAQVTICVASKDSRQKKTGKRRRKKLLYVVWKVRLTPPDIRETYRKRFGIETSYRQMNEARIRTCTRDPSQRLLFVGIALVLRNVWVWLHFTLAKGKWNDEPQLFLELLRFNEMLLWITQVVQRLLRADQTPGIDRETYQRLTATY